MELLALLPRILDALDTEHVNYALVGGLASNLWVADEKVRETFDIDFAVKGVWSPERVMEALQSPAVSVLRGSDLNLSRADITRLILNDTILDFVSAKSKEFMDSVFIRVRQGQAAGRNLPVVSAEDVFVFKALSKREIDMHPMCALAETSEFDREYVERWVRKLGVWSFAKRALPGYRRGR